ncbi:MAG: glutaminyl-tRNA synthase (glutamine-hydrolyzing) subunit A [Candidatus Spechtbacteria bacterium RIFCSPHIGHO2_02_FULL_43_15b]|uniref:Glutamyl-tRNA(Gln) amidotransferase subunit A n=1 Tax=Candidatus Spechtbacteria bacterium RIFCSPHIGHO2_01_FULL_43_30 TaxID=1802158 RepID=A0A1G2H8M4_9BACT|nr:MAG: glutaminyl-tRNA synthase (glutamine-hydrolyzing) subunit A [Candidatus Spechtbacteria bacterium RIFCSPHIGHO2_01_FULL_43_30]OGZ59136.1 MAG: glutaminyl-tRNA synthase (glutamine-hydrolyzing) subunit A [Candidatus Spechtbacteria bacterium RIFCSPHIGHO2_02_FULL_43_15b]
MSLINDTQKKIKDREVSARDAVKEYLNVIKEKDSEIHAYLDINEEEAMMQADSVDSKVDNGEDIGLLGGVTIAVKDNILARGFKCTAGSKMLENYRAPYDATVIRKLREAGAIILGKTNLDEFAMGSSTENSAYGPTKNPCDLSRVPGGSSGGSAAAVAAGMCALSLGSDTGGSIRQPAAFCGTVGFKPTYGAVSRYGLIAMASSLDQIGPIGASVDDVKAVFNVIRGKDKLDATSFDMDFRSDKESAKRFEDPISELSEKIKDLRVGVPKEYFGKGIDDKVKEAVERAIKKYEENGVKVEEVSLPHTEYGLAVYYIIMPSEVSANLARYDGIRYGQRAKADSLFDTYEETRRYGFGEEVRRRIMLGTHTLSSGYYDAYYLKAQKVRVLIKQDFVNVFSKVDVIMTPATPSVPFKFGDKSKDPVLMYLSDVFTVGASLAGLPAITLPCDWVKEGGSELPISFQIIGREGGDFEILEIAKLYENL